MRRIAIASALPLIATIAFCAWSCLGCAIITFGIPPYEYRIETLRGTLTIERIFSCLHAEWPSVALQAPDAFDRAFYEGWSRATVHDDCFGVFTCDISYVISPEAQALDPQLVLTPASFMAVPHGVLLGAAALPLALALACAGLYLT